MNIPVLLNLSTPVLLVLEIWTTSKTNCVMHPFAPHSVIHIGNIYITLNGTTVFRVGVGLLVVVRRLAHR